MLIIDMAGSLLSILIVLERPFILCGGHQLPQIRLFPSVRFWLLILQIWDEKIHSPDSASIFDCSTPCNANLHEKLRMLPINHGEWFAAINLIASIPIVPYYKSLGLEVDMKEMTGSQSHSLKSVFHPKATSLTEGSFIRLPFQLCATND